MRQEEARRKEEEQLMGLIQHIRAWRLGFLGAGPRRPDGSADFERSARLPARRELERAAGRQIIWWQD
jgi:hypothetical protein